MQDRPDAVELAQAVREFLQNEIAPSITDERLKFRLLVAMNALAILARELEHEDDLLRSELENLSVLLGSKIETDPAAGRINKIIELNRHMTKLIRVGEIPPGTLSVLKKIVSDKLKIASPKYLERFRPY
ncbi:MAG: DUF6285 domain-containing protein [Burkholderiales bacterium]